MMVICRRVRRRSRSRTSSSASRRRGATAHVSRGEVVTVIGAIGRPRGDRGKLQLEAMPGVDQVVADPEAVQAGRRGVPGARHGDRRRAAVKIGGDHFGLIAGPCTVESREQMLETARAVQGGRRARCCAAAPSSRAPRRTPSRGSARRAWSSSPRRASETGLPIVTEVMDAARRRGRRSRYADMHPDRRPQHAELPPARGGRPARQAGAAQARPGGDASRSC